MQNSVQPRKPAIKANEVGRTISVKLIVKNENKLEYRLAGFKDRTAEEFSVMTGEFPGNRADIIESVALGLSKEEAINA